MATLLPLPLAPTKAMPIQSPSAGSSVLPVGGIAVAKPAGIVSGGGNGSREGCELSAVEANILILRWRSSPEELERDPPGTGGTGIAGRRFVLVAADIEEEEGVRGIGESVSDCWRADGTARGGVLLGFRRALSMLLRRPAEGFASS